MKKLLILASLSLFGIGCKVDVIRRAEAGTTTCATCANVTPAHPAILVHGRNDTSARWDTLVTNWSAKGYTENTNLFRIDMTAYCTANSFCAMLPAPDGTGATYVNESYANCLKRYIDEKVPCVGGVCPAVDIVTHSQGGVMARYYTRFLAGTRQVNDLVVMAAPLGNGITNCTLAGGSCPGVNPEDCPDSAFAHKINGVAPEGDGTNDETPAGTHYSATVSTGDKTVPPWCSGYFILNPQTQQGDDLVCTGAGNFTLDPDADSCKLTSVLHLVIPTNATAINDAYCKLNNPE